MKKIFLVIKAEIEKQQKHDYHSTFGMENLFLKTKMRIVI